MNDVDLNIKRILSCLNDQMEINNTLNQTNHLLLQSIQMLRARVAMLEGVVYDEEPTEWVDR